MIKQPPPQRRKQQQRRRKQQHVRPQYGGDGPGSVDPRACENELLIRFYRAQNIVPAEEWDAFERSLRSSLPMVLRVLQSRPGWEHTLAELQRRGGDVVSPLEWCGSAPAALAWQCASSAYSTHDGGELRRWSQQQNSRGTVSFQEAVSMLPPLLLAPQPDHVVLDMCAAPGSKTMQLLDSMHAPDEWAEPGQPHVATGMLVAADVSGLKMTSVVAGRLRKIHSPALALAVGNSKNFPCLQQPSLTSGEQAETVLFDRVLCDVPCTGDGTIRKNPAIWKSWSLQYALQLHITQLRLLRRGLRLLRPGGRLVYSTCSLNPIENEAVVLSALRAFPGRVSLEDASLLAPLVTQAASSDGGSDSSGSSSLRVSKGLETWCVPDIRCQAASAAANRAAKRSKASSKGEIREGDWECSACGANVFAYKLSCFKCKAPKPPEPQPEPQPEPEPEPEPQPEPEPEPEPQPQPQPKEVREEQVVFSSLAEVPREMLRRYTPGAPLLSSMFPDRLIRAAGDGVDGDEATDASLRAMLERCVRILPHHNDTGGFFVAVFRRDCAEEGDGRDGATVGTATAADSSANGDEDDDDDDGAEEEQEHEGSGGTGDVVGPEHSEDATPSTGHGAASAGSMFYAKQRYALMDSSDDDNSPVLSEVWRSIAEFYGFLPDAAGSDGGGGSLARQNLAVVFDPDGEARKIDLLTPSLRDFLRGDVGEQNRLQFVSLGMRTFKRLEPGFLKPARCRWRPCHESAEYIGRVATRRRILLAREPLLEFLQRGQLEVDRLCQLERDGLALGLRECDAWPEITAQSIGGVVVGCLAVDGQTESTAAAGGSAPAATDGGEDEAVAAAAAAARVWVAGALTGKQLESYADKAELVMARELLGDERPA
jgi:16S rRNA C967 or C1407 C5-methylase (RsmB/RsmF family)